MRGREKLGKVYSPLRTFESYHPGETTFEMAFKSAREPAAR